MISELYPPDVHGRDVPDLCGIKNGATFLKDFSGSTFLKGFPEFEEASRKLPFQIEWMPLLQSLGAYDFILLIQDHDSETHSWTEVLIKLLRSLWLRRVLHIELMICN